MGLSFPFNTQSCCLLCDILDSNLERIEQDRELQDIINVNSQLPLIFMSCKIISHWAPWWIQRFTPCWMVWLRINTCSSSIFSKKQHNIPYGLALPYMLRCFILGNVSPFFGEKPNATSFLTSKAPCSGSIKCIPWLHVANIFHDPNTWARSGWVYFPVEPFQGMDQAKLLNENYRCTSQSHQPIYFHSKLEASIEATIADPFLK